MQQLTDTYINKRYRLYDNRGRSIDRYTLVDMQDFARQPGYHRRRLYAGLGFSEGLVSYCEHCNVVVGPHLGTRINASSFPDIRTIISDIF